MFRLAIEKALNHMVNVNNIDIAHIDNKIVSFRVEDIDLSLFFFVSEFSHLCNRQQPE